MADDVLTNHRTATPDEETLRLDPVQAPMPVWAPIVVGAIGAGSLFGLFSFPLMQLGEPYFAAGAIAMVAAAVLGGAALGGLVTASLCRRSRR